MTDAKPTTRKRRKIRQAVYGSLVLLTFVCTGWYLTSDSFRELIRHRIINQLEDATGGKVEIGRIQWNLARLRIGIDSLTIHGLEPAGQAPLLQVRRIDANIRIVSFLQRQISLKNLNVSNPSVNLLVYPDGSTNQPTPRTRKAGIPTGPMDPLFDIAVRNLVVTNGLLKVNERRTPFDLAASDLTIRLGYQSNPEFYNGRIELGKFDAQYDDLRPFSLGAVFDFRLYRNSIEMRAAHIISERSELAFDGKLTNFAEPRVEGNYTAKIDLRQIAAITRVKGVQSGSVELRGKGAFDAQRFLSNGNVTLLDVGWSNPSVHVISVSGSSNYYVDRDKLAFDQVALNALGGSVGGAFTVLHWNAPPREHVESPSSRAKGAHAIEAVEQNADGKFELHNLQLERIAAMFHSTSLPLSSLHAVGSASGKAEFAWQGRPIAAELKLALDAVPPATADPHQMPLGAHFQGTYAVRDNSVRISQADLQSRGTHLNATGFASPRNFDLAVGLTTTNMNELEPLLMKLGNEMPLQVAGEGSFQGTIEGNPSLPNINGHLRLTDFETVIKPPTAATHEPELVKALHKKGKPEIKQGTTPAPLPQTKPVRFHWDSFDGYVAYGPSGASVRGGVLRSGSARFEVAASTTLQNGAFTDTSVFHGNARIRDARVEDAQALLGFNYPVTGTLNLEIQMEGTRLDPRGTGVLTIIDGTAYGQPMQSLSTDLTFSGREARFSNIQATSDSAKAEGSGLINVSTEAFQFDLRGTGIDLLRFPEVQTSKVKLTGIAEFNAKGSGTLSEPHIEGHVRVGNVSLGGKKEGELLIDATTHGETLDVTTNSHFVTATVEGKGSIRMRGDLPSDITVAFGNVDLQPFLQGIARGHSSIDGTLHVTGPLRHPVDLEARLEIPKYESVVEGKTLRNVGPLVATYKGGIAKLEAFRITGENTDLTSTGTVQLTGTQPIKVRADGKVNLTFLQSFNPDLVAYGNTNIAVRVGGNIKDPSIRGRITIEHAGVSYVDLPNGLSDLNGSLVFNEDRLQVESLTAHTGGGDLAISGFIGYGRIISFNLAATGKDVRIRYPEGVSSNGDADLRLVGTVKNAMLSGDVVINKFGLNPRFDFASYFATSKNLPATPKPDSPLNNLHFDVRVISTPELQVQTSLARITGNVDLRLRGTALRPVLLGRISIVEGNVTFNGTKYRLDRGDILFANPTKIDPVLDLEASARVSDYDISIGLHGTTEKLNTSYRSDPPLPTADVFALLAFGHTTQPYMAPGSSQFTETASSAVLGSALNAAISSRVQKLFGASRIKIDPEVGGAENNPNARITVEQQVSGNITLTYITNLTQSAQQVIQFEYNVNRNVSIVGVRDEYGVVGFEVQVRQRKR
ncbi:protein of unknown function DUF490 [Candidatus Koribacter versatilis Ellin345]|uniref:Translocation and assembly module TamB C-terminal domain-containing protein n=1 Tax=Koribacter versatilis (strain Ellin345) TaxID=204669 RepID=Q1INS5_KORVE|nr:translocation/assembly module TamB domain-containing protein [Candidatus Koribacter versatilis]ABF41475.1 protein of unknown function DUF490 [Candidatus Koribacter versatilis Ellin345]